MNFVYDINVDYIHSSCHSKSDWSPYSTMRREDVLILYYIQCLTPWRKMYVYGKKLLFNFLLVHLSNYVFLV